MHICPNQWEWGSDFMFWNFKKWYWKFKQIGNHFDIPLFHENLTKKWRIPPLSKQSPLLPFCKKYFIPTHIAKFEEVNPPPFIKGGSSNYVFFWNLVYKVKIIMNNNDANNILAWFSLLQCSLGKKIRLKRLSMVQIFLTKITCIYFGMNRKGNFTLQKWTVKMFWI